MSRMTSKISTLLIAFALFLAAAVCAVTIAVKPTYAYTGERITLYNVTYDIKSDRTMHVSEDITCAFYGHSGIECQIPANAGDRVRNVQVKVYKNYASEGELEDISYKVEISSYDDSGLFEDKYYVSLAISDGATKYNGQEQTFHVEYDYEITQPQNKNAIYLNPVGFGWACPIEQANITLKLPDGYTDADLYIGDTEVKSNEQYSYDEATNTITATVYGLSSGEGVTFDLHFSGGLSTRFDIVPYIVIIAACVILAALVALKFFKYNSDILTPVVNFTAPDDMDPLVMGKLIDYKVNTEDITSLIYYWADKGYLKINLEKEDDPELIRIVQTLPEGAPKHQHTMYNALFASGDSVYVSQLENKFYPTIDSVKKEVNAKYKKLYNSNSIFISVLFALAGTMLMILPPVILANALISKKLFYYYPIIMIIPGLIIYGLFESLYYARLKLSRKKKILAFSGIVLLAAIMTAFYVLMLPGVIMETIPKLLACELGYVIIFLSVTVISRNKSYTKKLNEIIGFKNFIIYTEKEKLEAMLESDPQFYYHILPYAQVLGVTDIWENKFKGLSLEPPRWSTSPVGTYFQVSIISRSIRVSNSRMTTKLTARPQSSSSGSGRGRFGGGSFGGHGGGGHGGGGGRFI